MGYARKVKHIVLAGSDAELFEAPHRFILDELFKKKPTMTLLPNLEKLEITFNNGKHLREIPLLFMSNDLKSISIFYHSERLSFKEPLPQFLEEVAMRCPNLISFELWCKEELSFGSFQQHIVKLLSGLEKLEHVRLPLYAFSPTVMNAISKLPKLSRVENEGAGVSRMYLLSYKKSFSFCRESFQIGRAHV